MRLAFCVCFCLISILFLLAGLPMIATVSDIATVSATDYPDEGQALVKLLWGHRGFDYWEHTAPSGGDSVSYAFTFVTPDSSATLDLPASVVILTADVDLTCKIHGSATAFIDTATQTIKANEVKTWGGQVYWIHIAASDTGLVRVWADAD